MVDEVTARFQEYETALTRGDVQTMTECFDAGAGVVRFGINDMQRGADELAAWRANQGPLPEGRTLHQTIVSTFGRETAVVTTLFTYPGRSKVGRQSQTWFRDEGTWHIVHAHVSEIDLRETLGVEANGDSTTP